MHTALTLVFGTIVACLAVASASSFAATTGSPRARRLALAGAVAAAFVAGVVSGPRVSESVETPSTAGKLGNNVSSLCALHAGSKVDPGGFGSIDSVVTEKHGGQVGNGARLAPDDLLVFLGWAASKNRTFKAQAVCVEVDGKVAGGSAAYGSSRPDVAQIFSNEALAPSGYEIHFPALALSAGRHSIAVAVINDDGSSSSIGIQRIVGVKS
jgi:hypothetical protein